MGKQTANTEGIGKKVRDSAKFEIAHVRDSESRLYSSFRQNAEVNVKVVLEVSVESLVKFLVRRSRSKLKNLKIFEVILAPKTSILKNVLTD